MPGARVTGSSLAIVPGMPEDLAERWFAALQAELNEERAAALGRTGRQIDEQLARCRALEVRLDVTDDADTDVSDEVLEQYRAARVEFERWRWELCVQREALGLYDHRWVEHIYPTPARR